MKKQIALILTVFFFAFATTAQEATRNDSPPETETLSRVETKNLLN